MKSKEKKDYAFKEYLKGRCLTDIAKDKDKDNKLLFSYSWLQKTAKKENWKEQRKDYVDTKKEEIKEELLSADLEFSKHFLKKANAIIDMSLDSLADGFKDEKALVQFLKFLEDYKDKIKGKEQTINIKQEITTSEEQIEMIKNLSSVIERDAVNRANQFLENIKENNEDNDEDDE